MPTLTKEQIKELIPHRDPFLWLDEIVEMSPTRIVARKYVDPQLDVFRGHYPGKPIMPGVLLCEAAMQAGAVLIASQTEEPVPPGQVPVATRINNAKFRKMVNPGAMLEIVVDLTERLARTFFLAARVRVDGTTVAQLDFSCTSVDG